MSVTRLFSATMPFLFAAVAPASICGSATPAQGAPHAFSAAERLLHPARSSSIDPCLVGHWLSITVVGLNGAASGLAKMQPRILGSAQATLDLTGSTPLSSIPLMCPTASSGQSLQSDLGPFDNR
jgi:hypothetical protein